jgi:hypothetical protein
MCRDRHDRPRTVADEHIIRNQDRQLRAGHGVLGVAAEEHGRLRRLTLTLPVARRCGAGHVGGHGRRWRRDCRDPQQFLAAPLPRCPWRPLVSGERGYQRVFRGQHQEGGTEQGVRARGEHLDLGVPGCLEPDIGALAPADPVALHGLERVGPVEPVQIRAQPVGQGRDAEHPLAHAPAEHRIVPDLGAAIGGDLLVRQDRAKPGAPIVIRIGRGDLAARIMREPQTPKLSPHVGDIVLGRHRRMLPGLDGVLLGRQPECVKAERVQDSAAIHAHIAGIDVGRDIPERVTDMQSRPGWIGKHVDHVQFARRVKRRAIREGSHRIGSLEGPLVQPDLLPLHLNPAGQGSVVPVHHRLRVHDTMLTAAQPVRQSLSRRASSGLSWISARQATRCMTTTRLPRADTGPLSMR